MTIIVALLVPAALAAEDLPKSILAENMALDARFGQAIENKDIDGVMACFANTPDVQAVLYGTVLRGPAAIRQYMLGQFAFPGTMRGEIIEIRYTRVGDLVLAVGTVVLTFTPTVGTSFTMTEVWSDVRQKIAGKWVYLLDHAAMVP
jgi:ketosteroid isomerase-like protein